MDANFFLAGGPRATQSVSKGIKSMLNQKGTITHTDVCRKSTANPRYHRQSVDIPYRVPEIRYYGCDGSSTVRTSLSHRMIISVRSKSTTEGDDKSEGREVELSGEIGAQTSPSHLIYV